MTDRERAADQLFDALASVMLPVAQTTDRLEVTAATPEQVELVVELGALSRAIVEHNRRVLTGEPVEWDALADALFAGARECRGQVVLDVPHDQGDAGSR